MLLQPVGYYPGAQPVGSKYARWGPTRTKEAALEQVVSWMAMEHKKLVDQQGEDFFDEVMLGLDGPQSPGVERGRGHGRGLDRPSSQGVERGRGHGRGQGRKGGGRGQADGREAGAGLTAPVAGHALGVLKTRRRRPSASGSLWGSSTATSSDSDDKPSHVPGTSSREAPKAKAKSRVRAKASSQAIGAAMPVEGDAPHSVSNRKRPLPVLTEAEQQTKAALKFIRDAKRRS